MELTVEPTTSCNCVISNVHAGLTEVRPRRIRWSQIVGFAVFSLILLWILWESTHGALIAFYTLEGTTLVLGGTSALLLATFGWSGAWQGNQIALQGRDDGR